MLKWTPVNFRSFVVADYPGEITMRMQPILARICGLNPYLRVVTDRIERLVNSQCTKLYPKLH